MLQVCVSQCAWTKASVWDPTHAPVPQDGEGRGATYVSIHTHQIHLTIHTFTTFCCTAAGEDCSDHMLRLSIINKNIYSIYTLLPVVTKTCLHLWHCIWVMDAQWQIMLWTVFTRLSLFSLQLSVCRSVKMAASVWDQTPVTALPAGKVSSVKHVSFIMRQQSSNKFLFNIV